MSENQHDQQQDANQGNVFGPKMTLWGGIFILLFTALILYRHWVMDVPFGWQDPQQQEEAAPVDSLSSE
ncbi:MAG: hypothetical protein R2795_14080 [Saprospiraceae bacterium]